MILGSLSFGGWSWLVPAGLAVALALAVLVWSYRSAPAGPRRWACLLLKFLGIAALGFCLLEPLWTRERARPGSNLFAIVADNSQTLAIVDPGAPRSRGEQMRQLLDPVQAPWQAKLAESFEVRRYLFDARLQNIRDFGELTFDGRASGIGSALKAVADRFKGRPLAGVLLLSDGNATDVRGPLPDIPGLPPVYPVVIGSRSSVRDLSIQQVNVSQSVFEDAPVAVQAEVVATGMRGEGAVVRLVDRAGVPVGEQRVVLRGDGEVMPLRFQFKPQKPGVSFYELRAVPEGDLKGGTNRTSEATLANNSRVVVVDRGIGTHRILYVGGRPNWEFKFLNRAAQEDPQVQLVGLIRIAKREPKFDFRGRSGETSNPLFRGFGDQSREGTERYDQPVLTRLNTRDEMELRSGFPKVAEDLYGYRAVIIDDVESEFFTPEQATLLQKFVSERGGGFLMLGGMESFQNGQYGRTPIGEMLPVYLDQHIEARGTNALKYSLAREGWLQPWARLREVEAEERSRLESMPPFGVFNRVRGVKPGASVVGTATDDAGDQFPTLVVQRFGRGRTAALTIGDFWRWGMQSPEAHTDMDKAWRQILRWLVADVPDRVELTVEPQPDDASGAVRLQVRVRDAQFQPLDNAAVTLAIEPVNFTNSPAASAGTNIVRLQAEPSLKDPGVYETTFIPRGTGGYRASAVVTNSVGAEVGRAEAGWSTDLAAEEFRSLVPNAALLENIAKKTGGELVAEKDLDAFVAKLPTLKSPVMEPWAQPLWHTPLMFAFALVFLVAEWGLRRTGGMP